MPVLIALLRGVNVGGKHKVPMADLRAVCESLGLARVETCLQSGNVLFHCAKPIAAAALEDAIERRFAFRVPVVLRTPSEMRAVIAHNPFPAVDPAKLLVWFLATDPGEEARRKVLAIPAAPEEVRASGRELYIFFANGMARPKLSMAVLDRALAVPGTGRNWNTVRKLAELAGRLAAASVAAG